jgi:hypothetical protein
LTPEKKLLRYWTEKQDRKFLKDWKNRELKPMEPLILVLEA